MRGGRNLSSGWEELEWWWEEAVGVGGSGVGVQNSLFLRTLHLV